MSFVIVGVGAMGRLIGGKLLAVGEQVAFLDYREDRARRLHQSGFTLEAFGESRHVDVYADHRLETIPAPSVVLVCVKTYQTLAALERLRPWFTTSTLIILIQNGVPDLKVLTDFVAPAGLAFGVTTESATSVDETTVRHTGRGTTYLGPLLPATHPILSQVRFTLNRAGFDTRLAANILPHAWTKLLINIGINSPAAIWRIPNGELLDRTRWGLVTQVIKEGLAVMIAKPLTPVWDPYAYAKQVCEMTSSNLNSMLQDLQAGRRTEIDALNGFIAKEAEALSIPAPVNSCLTTLIQALEQQKRGSEKISR